MKIEVGKKYAYNSYVCGRPYIVTVKYIGKKLVFVESDQGTESCYAFEYFRKYFKEYKEPKIEKFQRGVRLDDSCPSSQDKYFTCTPSCGDRYPLIGKVEFTVTDGKLTNVEIMND